MKEKKKQISIILRKQGKKEKQKIWVDIAKRIIKPKRTLTKINLWKLDKIAKKQKGKIFIVPGHVLGSGELDSEIKVAALGFSKTAKEKIKNAKGKTFNLTELLVMNQKTSSMVIIK